MNTPEVLSVKHKDNIIRHFMFCTTLHFGNKHSNYHKIHCDFNS